MKSHIAEAEHIATAVEVDIGGGVERHIFSPEDDSGIGDFLRVLQEQERSGKLIRLYAHGQTDRGIALKRVVEALERLVKGPVAVGSRERLVRACVLVRDVADEERYSK